MMFETLFDCFSGKQRHNERSKLDFKRKLFPKRKQKETEDKDTNQTSSPSWKTPSADVMEEILRRVNAGDRKRLSIVSKSWNSIVTRKDIRSAPHELPWLLLPHPRNWKYLSFSSLSEGKVVKFKPPKKIQGGWIYGSKKGFLIIIKEKRLKSTMFLLNPISGDLHKLPPFKTIPSFLKFVKTREWKLFGAFRFCSRIAVSMSDNINSNCWRMVATILEDYKTLGVCRPGDNKWSVLQVLDINQDERLMDIMFSSGTLYALVQSNHKNAEVAATRTLTFEDYGMELKLKLVYDKQENINESIDEDHSNYTIIYNADYRSMLSESTGNEVLVIHQMLDAFWRKQDVEGNNNNNDDPDYDNIEDNNDINEEYDDYDEEDIDDDYDEEDIDDDYDDYDVEDIDDDYDEEDNYEDNNEAPSHNPYMPTRSFRAYKIDPENDNFITMQSLGDQLLFLGEDGAFSFPASDFKENEKNCIYFATNYVLHFELAPETYTSREIGIFYFNGERIERSFPSLDISLRYQPTWFTPCF